MTYFLSFALTDRLTTLDSSQSYRTIYSKVEEFLYDHPDFEIPIVLERLYWLGIIATKLLSLSQQQKAFRAAYNEWLPKCNFWGAVDGLSDEAILDPDYAFRIIQSSSGDLLQCGENAMRLMLRWAAHEWNTDKLSTEECKAIFGQGLGDLPQDDIAEHLNNNAAGLAKRITHVMIGVTQDPTPSDAFLDQYAAILRWVLLPSMLPPRSVRIFALKSFLGVRLWRLRMYFTNAQERASADSENWVLDGEENDAWMLLAGKHGLPTSQQAAKYAEEVKAVDDLERLETVENDTVIVDKERSSAIHSALVKSFAIQDNGFGLLDDGELLERSDDCRKLILQYREAGRFFQEYHACCQNLRLTWQRYMQHQSIPAEAIMPLVNEAHGVFARIRDGIIGLKPSDDLLARVRLSQDFVAREHENYALAGRYMAFQDHWAEYDKTRDQNAIAKAVENLNDFRIWAFRSKGKGFLDVLNLESRVAQAVEINSPSDQKVETTATPVLLEATISSHRAADPAQAIGDRIQALALTSPQIKHPLSSISTGKKGEEILTEMMNGLPDGVVVVDFVEIRYSKSIFKLIAMIYRKGQASLPVGIPGLSMDSIDLWVKDNMNLEQKKETCILGGPNSNQKLLELSNILRALIGEMKDVIAQNIVIKPGETVIFCPTGSLTRIPIHAIPVQGKPFIERNPVVYCQSITVLHWLWQRSKAVQQPKSPTKRILLNPLSDNDIDGNPMPSRDRVREVAQELGAEFYHGSALKAAITLPAICGSSLFHYHGHIVYNPTSALDSSLALNEKGRKYANREFKPLGSELLTSRNFF